MFFQLFLGGRTLKTMPYRKHPCPSASLRQCPGFAGKAGAEWSADMDANKMPDAFRLLMRILALEAFCTSRQGLQTADTVAALAGQSTVQTAGCLDDGGGPAESGLNLV